MYDWPLLGVKFINFVGFNLAFFNCLLKEFQSYFGNFIFDRHNDHYNLVKFGPKKQTFLWTQ